MALGAALLAAPLGVEPARAESLFLTWTAPGDDGSTGRAARYELRYATAPVSGADTLSWWNGAAVVSGLPAPLSAGSRESFLVNGLQPATTYYFILRTEDEVPNVSPFSNISMRTTTAGGSSLVTPAGFAARAVSGDVELSWQAVTGGTAQGYRVYRRSPPDTTNGLLATLALTETTWSDTTAVAGATYEYALVSFDGAGESARATAGITMPGDDVLATATPLHGYPNPARGQVTIRFEIAGASDARVRVTIFDLTGRRICTLFDGTLPPGEQAIEWACRSDQGNPVAPGVYNVILDAAGSRTSSQLAILP
jgi:hypothetical protein